jgi:hypothetical protein
MKGFAYLFKKGTAGPINFVDVEISDNVEDESQAVLIATHELMKDFRVELFLEDGGEAIRKRARKNTGKGKYKSTL